MLQKPNFSISYSPKCTQWRERIARLSVMFRSALYVMEWRVGLRALSVTAGGGGGWDQGGVREEEEEEEEENTSIYKVDVAYYISLFLFQRNSLLSDWLTGSFNKKIGKSVYIGWYQTL